MIGCLPTLCLVRQTRRRSPLDNLASIYDMIVLTSRRLKVL